MTDLQNEISNCFKTKFRPNPNQLVKFDGYDPFEKEDAMKFFSGKTWVDIFNHLCSLENNMISGADFRLEEWSVLEPSPRYYYLRSYLEFLLETLAKDSPDEQYISDFFHQLYQTIYMYQNNAYSDAQKVVLRKIAAYTVKSTNNHKVIKEWKKDIIESINLFLTKLEKHG